MSKLLWNLSAIDNRVAPLVFAIRRWAREASITQSTPGPWFSNYQLTLLVLFYLQSVGILPKLNYLNEQNALPITTHDFSTMNGKREREQNGSSHVISISKATSAMMLFY